MMLMMMVSTSRKKVEVNAIRKWISCPLSCMSARLTVSMGKSSLDGLNGWVGVCVVERVDARTKAKGGNGGRIRRVGRWGESKAACCQSPSYQP